MGLLSSATSLTRYRVTGDIQGPVIDTVYRGLTKYSICDIDGIESPKSVGWTSLQDPFIPDFEGSSFVYGSYFVFSLRLDKKSISPKLVQKYFAIEKTKKLEASGRDFLTKNEKVAIKDHVINTLNIRIPASPAIYNIVWNYEEAGVWFFTNLKEPNEELETLFKASFGLQLIRIIPYSFAEWQSGRSGIDLDVLTKLTPTKLLR